MKCYNCEKESKNLNYEEGENYPLCENCNEILCKNCNCILREYEIPSKTCNWCKYKR